MDTYELCINVEDLNNIESISDDKIKEMKDTLLYSKDCLPELVKSIISKAKYSNARIEDSGLSFDDIKQRYSEIISSAESKYSYYVTFESESEIYCANQFKGVNERIRALMEAAYARVLDKSVKTKDIIIDLIRWIGVKPDFEPSNTIEKALYLDNGMVWFDFSIFNKDSSTFKLRTTPFASFEVFYTLLSKFDVVISNYLNNTNSDLMGFQIPENVDKYTENLIIVSKYINLITNCICFSILKDIYTLVDDFVDYIIDGEDVEPSILPSVVRLISFYEDYDNLAQLYSSEGIRDTTFNVTKTDAGSLKGVRAEDIDEKYKSKTLKMKKMYIDIFKIGPVKRKMAKHAKFFKKYFGRIPGLYNSYANESYVFENKLKDDPATILSTKAVKFIDQMSQFTESQFAELLTLIKKISSSSDSVQRISLVKSYCKHYPIDNQDDPKMISAQIENETYFRIANAILKNIELYGYTVEGIVQNKKFPSANHIVVSMFIDNPNEVPEKQPVSQIFKNPNSLLVFSKEDNFQKFTNLYSTASSKILGQFKGEVFAGAINEIKDSSHRIYDAIKNDQGTSFAEQSDPALQKKIVKAIENALVKAIDLMSDQKSRVLQCTAAAYEMVERISKTAQMCVVAMLQTERSKVDKQYADKLSSSKLSNFGTNRQLKNNIQHVEGKETKEKPKYRQTLFNF